MRLLVTTSLVLAAIALSFSPALPEAPSLVNYQGIVTDAGGMPLDGTYALTFKVYSDSTGGTLYWFEMHPSTDISDGLFNVILGEESPFPGGLFDNTELWMGVTVDADPEIVPRTRLTAVPWAIEAAEADSADGVRWMNIAGVPAGFADGVDDVGSGDGHSLDAVDGSPVDAVYVDPAGDVGIGTTTPSEKLEVRGDVLIDTGTGNQASFTIAEDGDKKWSINYRPMVDSVLIIFDEMNYDNVMSFQPGTGNVGIGTHVPTSKLTVAGEVFAQSVQLSVGASNGYVLTSDPAGNGSWQPVGSGADGDWNVLGPDIYSALPGDVGIGTSTPQAKLHVRGTLDVGIDGGGHDVDLYGSAAGSRVSWDAGRRAFRAGWDDDGDNWLPDSTGFNSFAAGKNTRATGGEAVAMGNGAVARNTAAISLGYHTKAFGYNSVAMGSFSRAMEQYSTAMGWNTQATGRNSVAMGRSTQAEGDSGSVAMGYLSTAYGGASTAGGYSSEAYGTGSVAIGYDAVAGGFAAVALGRDTQADLSYSTSIGHDCRSSDIYAVTIGGGNRASGFASVAMGLNTEAVGDSGSFAIGSRTLAGGKGSIAGGIDSDATGVVSLAFGRLARATGPSTMAIGWDAEASGDSSVAIGTHVAACSTNSISIGCGVSDLYKLRNTRHNSLVVGFRTDLPTLFVGGPDHRVGIGTTSPGSKLHVRSSSSSHGMLRVQNSNTGDNEATIGFFEGSDTAVGEDWVVGVGPWGNASDFVIGRSDEKLVIQPNGDVGIGTNSPGYKLQVGNLGDGTEARSNGWNLLSSREYKTDIEAFDSSDYSDVLNKVADLDVVRYRYVNDENAVRHVGVIAEDSPQDILAADGKAISLGDYTSFLLAAIKAQQEEIELLKEEVRDLKSQ
jgi:hypothetical protein